MLIVRSSAAAVDWFASHAANCARALSIDMPGFRRPMISMPTVSSLPRSRARTRRGCDSGAQKSGRADLEAAEALRHHADDLVRRAGDEHGASDHVRVALEVALANPCRSARSPDCRRHDRRQRGRSARPITGLTSTTSKKLPDTSLTAIIRPSTRRSISFTRRVGIGEDAGFRSHRFETRTREQRDVAIGLRRPLDGVHLGDVRAPCRCGTASH